MRDSWQRWLVIALVLPSACKSPATAHKTTPTPQPSSASLATATPAVGASAAVLPEGLHVPAGDALHVAGTLTVDAGYAVAAGQAVVTADGQHVVLAGSPLISDNGLELVANNGSNLVGKAKLISDNGLGLISRTGIIGNNAGTLVANNGSSYRLQGVTAPAVGTSLPAGGMLLSVVGLADGQPLPLGTDASGKPVYAIFTDANGHYDVYLPTGLSNNVRLVATPPKGEDLRLQYGLVFAPARPETAAALDDAQALGTAFLRIQMARFLAKFYGRTAAEDTAALVTGGTTQAAAALLEGQFEVFRQAFDAAGSARLSPAARVDVCQAVADALLARVDLDQVQVDQSTHFWSGPEEPALGTIVKLVKEIDTRTAAQLAKDPTFFDRQPYMLAINAALPAGQPPLRIQRADDLATLILGSYLSDPDSRQFVKASEALVDLGLSEDERFHLSAAAGGIYKVLLTKLLTDDTIRQALLETISEAAAAALQAPATASPTPGPLPTATPTPVAVTVQTLAGSGKVGSKDGPADQASFGSLQQLAIETHGDGAPTLYAADGHGVRVLTRGTSGWTVATLAGGPTAGRLDGPGATARFATVTGLALDGVGHLYVGEYDNNDVRMIDLLDPTHPVSTIAGDGTAGYVEGPGATARFAGVKNLVFQPPSRLLVADYTNKRIRTIDLGDPSHPTGTFYDANVGRFDHLATPVGLAFDATGALLVSSGTLIKRIGADGVAHLVAGNDYGGVQDGFWADAAFGEVFGLARDAQGIFYGTDYFYHGLFRMTSDGHVTALVPGHADQQGGFADGPGTAARLNAPTSVVVGADGSLYVADQLNHRIRVVTLP